MVLLLLLLPPAAWTGTCQCLLLLARWALQGTL
jgi:hypothetical protein